MRRGFGAATEGRRFETPPDPNTARAAGERTPMLKWLLVTVLALVAFSGLRPWLERLGVGRLPGDLNFRAFGRHWSIPIASTIVLSLIAAAIAKLV